MYFFRSASSKKLAIDKDNEESQLGQEDRLTKEEWHAINKLLSYQPEEDSTFVSGKEMQNMILFLVNVSISQAAARIITTNQTEIICGRFEQLEVTTKRYYRSVHCDVSLKFYGLSAPEGSLAEVCSFLLLILLGYGFYFHDAIIKWFVYYRVSAAGQR